MRFQGAKALAGIAPRDELPQISVGDNVVHDQLGEGVVTGTDPDGGTIAVRFASGSEKRLIADHTAVSRLTSRR